MRIGLNLLHALPEIGGGWNYIENLLGALGIEDNKNSYFAFITHASAPLVPDKSNFRKIPIRLNSRSRTLRILYENTFLQLLARKFNLHCMHWFAATQALINSVPAVVTFYDLQAFLKDSDLPFVKRELLKVMMAHAANRAAILLPMSKTTAGAMRDRFGVDAAKMIVIPNVLQEDFKPVGMEAINRFKKQHNLPDSFWLYVAHLYPHKNHVRLLQAYHCLKADGYRPWPLVLRGDSNSAQAEVNGLIEKLGLLEDIIWLPRLNREVLPTLYSSASALVFPSLYEGAGLPLLEAMACGCPIIASDIPSVREFCGESAVFFDPMDIKKIAETMQRFQGDGHIRNARINAGLRLVEHFRPSTIAKKIIGAYEQASLNR